MGATPPEPPGEEREREAPGVAERLASLDLKLDYLSKHVEECLVGIQGLHGCGRVPPVAPEDSSESTLQAHPWAKHDHIWTVMGAGKRASYITSADRRSTRLVCRSTRLVSAILSTIHPASEESVLIRRSLGPVALGVWKFLSNPESGFAAGIYNCVNSTFILLSVLLTMVQSTSWQVFKTDAYMGIECSIEALFLLEISILFFVCPYRQYFLLKFYNIIDILSAIPLALRVYKVTTGGSGDLYTIVLGGLVPVVRLLKTLRHFQTSHLLANAFILAREAVPILVFYYSAVWLLFTAIIFGVEDRSNIPSLSDAMWLTAVTMTTIGYGDVFPVTAAGRLAAGALVLISTLYMAIPLGIIGSCFSAVWDDRDKILLFERLRTCLLEVGCSGLDVPALFSRFDKTQKGSLDALEFIQMCTSLKLNLSQERLMMLFNFWANDEDGRIEATTFQQILFPRDCLKVLEKQAQEQAEGLRRMTRGQTRNRSTPVSG